ncbi:PREDICTED: uncharacterized protein LOC109205719 [Nicotiana attenuata]|uniref:uncharacterized protein LOC109205719 n=1 Tax=Nicotiana attenuata TaxID=49451 RepID=UPI000905076F|nr:PREDICTED: uncharacterized protein LOC109205719 [Nicotiana attenuata]
MHFGKKDSARKVLLAYYGANCFSFVRKCRQCQIQCDLIHLPPLKLHPMSSPWPFVSWGMDVIWLIESKASTGHRFILVAIDYFTKRVEAVTFKAITKKAVTIIPSNAANINSHLMKKVCEKFEIVHRHSTPYRPKDNGVVEAKNKNIKKIITKMIQGSRQWHEKLRFALFGYRMTARTFVGATPLSAGVWNGSCNTG